jgi:hypothetical protein
MNASKFIAAKPSRHGPRAILIFFAIVLAAIASFPLLQRFYFLQELLFFVGLALLVMFLLVNLLILGLLFRRASRFVVHSIPRGRTSLTTAQKTLTESPEGSFVTASPIATEADSGRV